MKVPLNIPKACMVLVLLFLVLFVSMRSCEASTEFELGYSTHKNTYFIANEVFDDKYLFGIGLVSEGYAYEPMKQNAFIHAQRLVHAGILEAGLGVSFWQNQNRAIGRVGEFSLSLAVDLGRGWGLTYRHFSNAGTGDHNLGDDILLIRYTFE